MATESRAERRHPPEAVGHGVMQCAFEHKKNGRAAEIAVFAQARRRCGGRRIRSDQVFRATRATRHVRPHAKSSRRCGRVSRRRQRAIRSTSLAASSPAICGTCGEQNVSQHPVFLTEPQRVAFVGRKAEKRRISIRRGGGPAAVILVSTAAPAPSPNRHALMSTPGSSSR